MIQEDVMLILKGNHLLFSTYILMNSFTYQCTQYTTAQDASLSLYL